jgi:hypothetical protein
VRNDLDLRLRVRFLPRKHTPLDDLVIVPLADAVQEMCVDLSGAELDGKARRGSQELEQIIAQVRRVNT